MRFKSVFRSIPVAAMLLSGAMFSSPRAVLAAPSQAEVSRFDMERVVTAELKELRSLMNQLSRNADQLHALQTSRLHWETHAYHLTRVKDDVNRVGEQLNSLQTMRFSAAPWQQETIDAILPVALEVADRTGAAIEHLNSDRQYLWAPHYVDHLRTIPALSDHMRGLVENHLKIVEAQENLRNIQGELTARMS